MYVLFIMILLNFLMNECRKLKVYFIIIKSRFKLAKLS